jgi:hypothetical protein
VTWVLNRSIRPWTLSESARDAVIEQALCRQIVRRAIGDVGRAQPMALTGIDLVIGGPLFARWNQPGAAALALLDAVDVVPNDGVLDLALDADGLMAVIGAIGMVDPSLASSIFEYDTLVHLGAPSSSAVPATTATSPAAARSTTTTGRCRSSRSCPVASS